MGNGEAEAKKATLRFYQALDDLILGKGTKDMSDAWHHVDYVSTVHPFGHWAQGWQEVWATWEEIAAAFSCYRGHAHRTDGIGTIFGLKVNVLGDVAYTIGVYKSRLYIPDVPGGVTGLNVNCTNVVQKREGVWKMVHHHADQATPEFQAALARLVEAGQR